MKKLFGFLLVVLFVSPAFSQVLECSGVENGRPFAFNSDVGRAMFFFDGGSRTISVEMLDAANVVITQRTPLQAPTINNWRNTPVGVQIHYNAQDFILLCIERFAPGVS
jgi:hypothetical protein